MFLLRYAAFDLVNVVCLALILWLMLFASLYFNPFFYEGLIWDSSGTHRLDLTVAAFVAFALALTEWVLLLLTYPVNKHLLLKAAS